MEEEKSGFPFELIPSLVNGGIGLWETLGASKGLREFYKKPRAAYSVAPELQSAYTSAQKMATRGFAPEQKASFRQNIAEDINTTSRRALDQAGGNLGRVVNKIGNINMGKAENQFATQDAMLKDQHIKYANVLANQIQHQRNLKTQTDIHHDLLLENALGQGLRTGINNMGNAANFAALMLSGKNKPQGQQNKFGFIDGNYGSSMSPAMGGDGSEGIDTFQEDQYNLLPNLLKG